MQMNMEVKSSRYFKSLKKVPDMVHPIFWMEQVFVIAIYEKVEIFSKFVNFVVFVPKGGRN